LREPLIARGHRYVTHSDTETIIHLYEEYGADCVRHLRGMFAFAIWNRATKTLFIARDRLGIKPLYYQLTPGTVCCSDRKSKRCWRMADSSGVQSGALPEYLAFGYLSGEESFYSGIRS